MNEHQASRLYRVCVHFAAQALGHFRCKSHDPQAVGNEVWLRYWLNYYRRPKHVHRIPVIARHRVISLYRRDHVYVQFDEAHHASVSPHFALERDERRRFIAKLRTRLSPTQKAIIDLYLRGLSTPEMGAALRLSPEQVSRQLYKIRLRCESLAEESHDYF